MSLPQIDSLRATDGGMSMNSMPGKPARSGGIAVNILFIAVIIALVAFGLTVCWSACSNSDKFTFTQQPIGVAMGFVLMAIVWHFDYRKLANFSTFFFVISIVLIMSPHLPFIGVERNGAQSWIQIGMQVQPGEFAKITVVLLAASLMARYDGKLDDPLQYIKVLALLMVPLLCIMTQPDLGTGLVYLFIAATSLLMGGARPKYLIITVILGVAAIAGVFAIDELLKYQTESGEWEYRLLQNYQRTRLLVFMDQEGTSTSDSGYNLWQAKIAIGAGGLFGKGLLNATQSAMGFLPEAPSDFIFCVLAEELGFVGVAILLALYAALILISLSIARRCSNLFGMLIVCAIVGMWLFQILENIGMTCGLMPITGIPLPFVSYGSSFMVVNFVMLGLIGSVWSHDNVTGKRGGYAATH